jgi:lipoprotein signal peptidase
MDMRPNASSDAATGVLVAATVLLIDQVTKLIAVHGGTANVWRNPDYAFGVVGGSAALLIVGAVGVLGAFLVVARSLATRFGISMMLPALIAGGTLGNTLDRLRLGSVRDFMVTPWAIINVADLAVVAGVIGITIALAVQVPRLRMQPLPTTR